MDTIRSLNAKERPHRTGLNGQSNRCLATIRAVKLIGMKARHYKKITGAG